MTARQSPKEAMTVTPYQMAVYNTARYIRSPENKRGDLVHLDAWKASEVLAIAFCKTKEDVLTDLIHAKLHTETPR